MTTVLLLISLCVNIYAIILIRELKRKLRDIIEDNEEYKEHEPETPSKITLNINDKLFH